MNKGRSNRASINEANSNEANSNEACFNEASINERPDAETPVTTKERVRHQGTSHNCLDVIPGWPRAFPIVLSTF